MLSHFICRAYGAFCKHKHEKAECMHLIAVRIIRAIKTQRERVRTSAENYQKKHTAGRKLREFLVAMFSFPRWTLSLTCTAVISFLFALLAEINRAYNKVSRRRNGEAPSRGKWIAAGKAARFSQRTRVARKNIRTRLIKSFLIAPAAIAVQLPFCKSTGVERHFYGLLLSAEQLRVYSEFPFVLFFTVLFASPASGFWHSGFRCCSNVNRDWRTAVAYAANRWFGIFFFFLRHVLIFR